MTNLTGKCLESTWSSRKLSRIFLIVIWRPDRADFVNRAGREFVSSGPEISPSSISSSVGLDFEMSPCSRTRLVRVKSESSSSKLKSSPIEAMIRDRASHLLKIASFWKRETMITVGIYRRDCSFHRNLAAGRFFNGLLFRSLFELGTLFVHYWNGD